MWKNLKKKKDNFGLSEDGGQKAPGFSSENIAPISSVYNHRPIVH